MQELIMTRNSLNHAVINTRILFAGNIQDCYVKTINWSFFLPNCEQYHEGEFLGVSGSHDGDSDNGFFQLKRLTVQAVERISLKKLSVKYWWHRAQIFISHQKTSLLETGLRYLPPTHAELISGMVFGGTASLPQDIKEDFQITGLTHVVSASGYNVSIVAGIAIFIFSKFLTRGLSILPILLVVWSYAVAAELVPPVIRSSIMISLNLIALKVFFRQYKLLFSLILTAAIMLLWEPSYARSLSFWLSTLATMGIILFLPLLESEESWFSRLSIGHFGEINSTESNIIKESFLVTLAAQSLTLPLVIAVFGEVSLLSFVTNTMLLWLTPLITLSGLGLMIVGAFFSLWPGLWALIGPVLSLFIFLPTELFLSGVKWFGQFEWGLVKISLPW
ncbi:MAG: ComEC/Rec2 family competence protein [Candidatus Pacebacteria bacterium]|nr:ComEC/Rec2 family competence protein [Candidatus Paceibacterota bacterium]MBT6898771.1 ComEC/Rec2 family competence protein [Candidatus Paceibacterota bacterium]MBT7309679.1 ComEC/Rec2 family competence protein [Candidatus Paceibacterota bacterium]MBT7499474.1 ComEC/Rec2 family competence protein [Candidatus Paceibacterota bacterium]